jgi:SAM-dependent methyltransferase
LVIDELFGQFARQSPIVNRKFMSQDYWENRYQTKDMPWEKGAPSPGLVDFLAAHPGLPRGTVCVPGCGTGHDAREWAKAGFETFGFDVAPSAIQLANEKTAAAFPNLGAKAKLAGETPAPPGQPRITFQLGNFLHDDPPFQFDWLFEHTLFCAIDPGERDNYIRAVLRWLKPGGQFLAVNYLIPDKDGPPFGTTRDEQWQRFSAHFDLLEEWVPRSYPNRTGLELMLWWRRKS